MSVNELTFPRKTSRTSDWEEKQMTHIYASCAIPLLQVTNDTRLVQMCQIRDILYSIELGRVHRC